MADYIAQRLELDGLLFRSVQAGRRKNADGAPPQNVVLFNHAARVEHVDIAQLKFDVDLGWWDEDEADGEDGITVNTEELRRKRKPKPRPKDNSLDAAIPTEKQDNREVSLRLVPKSVTVERIHGVKYDEDARHVSFRHSSLKDKREERRRIREWAGSRPAELSVDFDPDIPF